MSLDIRLKGMDSHNYTHNVTDMWHLLGCYDALYNSEGMKAKDVLPVLAEAVISGPVRIKELRRLNPENGWGDADRALVWLYKVYCEFAEYPNKRIEVCK